ncbi:o-succinylbenzoate--CoA ligase [Psychromonas ossibalaenae]|uniref:o-succinylbenzoate--CoA ligase n=1 Tax=Psychromonas ossibalaenae TaxID=444922 RepID=UPI000370753A|nr:o-succinylbenzoate--CoA ligase [Psychromonas ossibalaenae]
MDQQLNYCPLRLQAIAQPENTAIQLDSQTVSFRDLDIRVSSIVKQLVLLKLQRGDRLACIAPNSLKLILLQLACIRNGVIFSPINPRFSKQEIESRLKVLNTEYVWVDQRPDSCTLTGLTLSFSADEQQSSTLKPLSIEASQVCNIIFTSGSSGLAKAVMHSFSNHYYSAAASQQVIPLHKGDRNLLSLPLFHISGYAAVMRTMLAGGTLVISAEKLTLDLLQKQQITHLSLVAAQLFRLLETAQFRQNKLNIKHLLLGGSAFPERLLNQTRERGFTYHLSYGLSEMSSQVATSTNSQSLKILADKQIKIINGEINLRGKSRFLGYFNNTLTDSLIPEEQWFASRDLGILRDNTLQITGRKDRLFISGGENIQPEEIESLLLSFQGVRQAYIVAVEDPLFGQRPVAFIDWVNDHQQEEQLNNYIKNKLSAFKRPVHYFLLTQHNGLKVSLKELQKTAEASLQP